MPDEKQFSSTDFVAGVPTNDGHVFLKQIGAFGTVHVIPSINLAIGFQSLSLLKGYLKLAGDNDKFTKNCKFYVRRTDTTIVEVQ